MMALPDKAMPMGLAQCDGGVPCRVPWAVHGAARNRGVTVSMLDRYHLLAKLTCSIHHLV